MNLFMSWIKGNLNLCYFNEFIQCNFFVTVNVKKIKNGFCMLFLNEMIWFYEFKVIYEILETRLTIPVGVVGTLPKTLEVGICYFS